MNNNIPKNAKKVFEGVIFDTWQWEQEMFDGTKEIFECIARPGTVFVIGIVDNKILVQKERQPNITQEFISLPGGRLNKGEDSLEGAKREFLEETGYVSNDWELWWEREQKGKIIWPFYFYIARNCVYKQDQKLDSGEKVESYYVNFSEFLDLAENKDFRIDELKLPLTLIKSNPSETQKFYELLFKK